MACAAGWAVQYDYTERLRVQLADTEAYAAAQSQRAHELVLTMDELSTDTVRLQAINDMLMESVWTAQQHAERREPMVLRCRVTAYASTDPNAVEGMDFMGNPNITATGVPVGPGTFAVDPQRIAFGSRLVVVYDDGTYETGLALDTGAAMRNASGCLVDAWRHTRAEARAHGVRHATVIVMVQP